MRSVDAGAGRYGDSWIMKWGDLKGGALERAVHMIQETLLESDPKLKGAKFTIEPNKRLTFGKSLHEIDLYVVTQPGTPSEKVTFFECKNWVKPVSNPEVMTLHSKVELFGASRGVLVAPSITDGALDLLKFYKRLEYKKCKDNFEGLLTLETVHTVHDPVKCTVSVTKRNLEDQFPPDLLSATCSWGGEIHSFKTIADRWVDDLANRDKVWEQKKYNSQGAHWANIKWRQCFHVGEFSVAGIDIASADLDVTFIVTVGVTSPKFMSTVEGDGRYAAFDVVHEDFPGRVVNIEVVLAN